MKCELEARPKKSNNIPRHIAIIMDGNGRWAKKRFRNRVFGHEAGVEAVKRVIKCCVEWGIPYLTLYAFSKENWQRPNTEIQALWHIIKRFLRAELPELLRNGVRIVHIGDREGLPSDVLSILDEAVEKTRSCDKLYVQVAINYGGRHEIVNAAKKIAELVKKGELDVQDIDFDLFAGFLHTSGVPDPDLLIRTSGEYRISNFLLWQIAYTELYITDVLWPDFDEQEFCRAIEDYQSRERRFGRISEQLSADVTCSVP